MKAIPMKGRLPGKRICGYLWAGPGAAWTKKENYFQLEDQKLVQGSEGDPITVERVTFLPEEPRGVVELRRLSEAFKEPEPRSHTST